jgi:uncharacterized protein (TIGR02117 family)
LFVVLAGLLTAGGRPVAGAGGITIQVASNGWHSAVILSAADLPPGAIPEAADFPAARWLSFGWGDAEYFPAREPGIGTALRAAILPTPAVVLLGGLTAPVRETWPTAEIVTLAVSRDGLRRLVAYLGAAFDRQGNARASPVAPGLEPFSRFYRATGSFHAFNTCNTWTARALDAAGVPVRVFGTITADDLMAQLREIAKKPPGSAN